LKTPAETEIDGAERYCLTELETVDGRFMTDEVSVYGITEDSAYIGADIPEGKILASTAVMDKFDLEPGDTLTLKARYDDETYDFIIGDAYDYDAGLAVFLTRADYLELFDKDEDYFTGYFTDERLSDIDEELVNVVITKDDMTKVSRQLKVSMGDFMGLFDVFGVIMFVLLMYLLSKQIIEKNAQSISMVKILGFSDSEIGRLYIVATSFVVIVSLLVAVPLTDGILRWAFHSYLYTEVTGYIPYIISKNCFVFMILMGLACYALVSLLQLAKIRRIPKSDALKNVE
jgi:putative ABC transport system permease protein